MVKEGKIAPENKGECCSSELYLSQLILEGNVHMFSISFPGQKESLSSFTRTDNSCQTKEESSHLLSNRSDTLTSQTVLSNNFHPRDAPKENGGRKEELMNSAMLENGNGLHHRLNASPPLKHSSSEVMDQLGLTG